MKKALIFTIIIALVVVVILMASKAEKNPMMSGESFEESAEFQEASQQSFRKTQSSILPPSVQTMPPEQGEEI